jgi:hypothetical protein|tara:strand:+ start:180 stop:416 length:237 start_codon:yes stop_codon:yes gene_type:complete
MEELDVMMKKFDVIKHTHPQLYNFWINYLKIKKQRINEIINRADDIIENITQENDLSMQEIIQSHLVSMALYDHIEGQ